VSAGDIEPYSNICSILSMSTDIALNELSPECIRGLTATL
jgi:hypothetical protein